MKTVSEQRAMIDTLKSLLEKEEIQKDYTLNESAKAQLKVIEEGLGYDEVYEQDYDTDIEQAAFLTVQWLAGEVTDEELLENYK
jgi:hypothetical protein